MSNEASLIHSTLDTNVVVKQENELSEPDKCTADQLESDQNYVDEEKKTETDEEPDTIPSNIVIKEEALNFNDISINKYKDNILSDIAFNLKTEEIIIDTLEKDIVDRTKHITIEREDVESATVMIKQESHEAVSDIEDQIQTLCPTEKVKFEDAIYENAVPFPEPDFDSCDDGSALGHVETCLHEDVHIKDEKGNFEELQKSEDVYNLYGMKDESNFKVTETHLISNKMINTTSTVTHCPDGVTEAHTTQTLVMEIRSIPCKLPCTEEAILPTVSSPPQDLNNFQLNSITGNVLSLEQEAFGLLTKKPTKKEKLKSYQCHLCTNSYRDKYSLKKHLRVHDSIDRYAKGRIVGKRKALVTIKKKSKLKMQKTNTEVKPETTVKKETQEYKCTCGKAHRRRTRMEACMRTHEDLGECSTYSCITCAKEFKSKEELLQHRKRIHSRKRFLCKFCPTEHKTRKSLFKHLRKHQKVQLMEYKVVSEVLKKKDKLKCFFCSKACADFTELKSHIFGDHKEPFKCKKCSAKFTNLGEFAHHTKSTHPDDKRQSVLDVVEALSELSQEWKCEECKLQFMEAEKLAVHKLEHHSEIKGTEAEPAQFQCPDCHRAFVSAKSLNSHRRIHTENTSETTTETVKGFLCVHCRKICKDENALTSHMRFHSPERKYVCKFCDFRFATSEKRKSHAEIHTGDLKYVCFICEYQCSSIQRLNAHKAGAKHLNMKEYLLSGQGNVSEPTKDEKAKETVGSNETEIKKTGKKKKQSVSQDEPSGSNDVPTPCDVCGETFPSESKMLEHKETHPFIEFPNEDKPTRIFFK